jgi:DNA-binding GntR family transcriptional regulator
MTNPETLAIDETQSLRDKAYATIKYKIMRLIYAPGAFMTEIQIKDDIGIGRMPVHQALKRLALEGFVTVISRKGVVIAPITAKEVGDLAELRELVEPRVARLAARNATSQDIAALRKIVDEAARLPAGDTEHLMQLDRDFHELLAAASGNPVLAPIARNVHERLLRFWYIAPDEGTRAEVAREHAAMVEAVAAHDETRAEAIMKKHVAHLTTSGDSGS